ncbi:hypothetical protein DC421_03240 [Priestia megaterium]|nr:hypothetical protein DC428_11395 [Priestia megaterium]PVE89093.1 hypothetical protein DC421_03240 [Priestia megaterium]PVE92783.1 hypothetical protein DC426_04895 [Priestia megaterium]PVE99149.1 hypothetical protein DC433_15085 [Priestia megaterium]
MEIGTLAVASSQPRTLAVRRTTPGPPLATNTAVKLPEELVSVARGMIVARLGFTENSTITPAAGFPSTST